MYANLRKQEAYVEQQLSDIEKLSINWYTGGNYDDFNDSVRKGKMLSQEQRDHKENIDTAFDSVPPLEVPIVVYKGKGSDRIYSDKSFMSTTLLYDRSKRFTNKECCVLQITVSAGSKVLPIRTISKEPDEEEILLNRDGILIVTGNSIRKEDMMKIIFVTYCPKGSNPVRTDEELKKADHVFDTQLIIEKLIESLQDEDSDFLDEDLVKISYSRVTGGRKISEHDLATVKKRLKIE
jgi:hypothetical protein